jgi:hypothetical protein
MLNQAPCHEGTCYMKAHLYTMLYLCTRLHDGDMSASHSAMFSPSTHWIRGLGDTRVSLDALDRWKNLLHLSRNDLWFLCHPACSLVTVLTERLLTPTYSNICDIRHSEQCYVPVAGLSHLCINCNTCQCNSWSRLTIIRFMQHASFT